MTNGRFGHWTVHDNPSEVGCDTEYQNPFGLLRAKDNTEGNPFITRFGGSLCDANTFSTGDMDAYNECFNVTGLTAFMGCYNFRVHARTHIGVGGSRPSFSNQTVGNWPSCTSYHDGSFIVVCVFELSLNQINILSLSCCFIVSLCHCVSSMECDNLDAIGTASNIPSRIRVLLIQTIHSETTTVP